MTRPTARIAELGAALKGARRQANMRQADVAARLQCSQPSIARMESGTRVPTPAELRTLLELYDVSTEQCERIEHLAQLPEDGVNPRLNSKFALMLRASEAAEAIYTFHSERIPMTLQCEWYALEQYRSADPSTQPLTAMRQHARRTRIFTLPRPPKYHAIMTISSLLRMPGGQLNLVKGQARHLLNLLDATPSLTLRVLDLAAPIAYVDSDFTLLSMPDHTQNMVYIPFGFDGQLIKEKTKVDERLVYWRQAEQVALTDAETRKLLHSLAEHDMETTATIRRGA